MAEDAEDKVHEGIEHLQAAAREMIQATRSLLDAAEELIDDPKSRAGPRGLARPGGPDGGQPLPARRRSAGDDDDDDGHVQRIKVS